MRPRFTARACLVAVTWLEVVAPLASSSVAAASAARPAVAQNGPNATTTANPSNPGRPAARPTRAADRPLVPSQDRGGDSPAAIQGEKTDKSEPSQPAPRPGAVPDLDKLRADYDRIREDLFKARVRSQKVGEAVYPSRLDLRLRWKGGPDFVMRKARFLLDGAELWDSADRAQTDDLIQVAERNVKPGPHALTVHLEIRPKTEAKGGTKTGADKLGYTSEHTFAIVVAETGRTHVILTGDEDGSPPEYEPELELEIETEK